MKPVPAVFFSLSSISLFSVKSLLDLGFYEDCEEKIARWERHSPRGEVLGFRKAFSSSLQIQTDRDLFIFFSLLLGMFWLATCQEQEEGRPLQKCRGHEGRPGLREWQK